MQRVKLGSTGLEVSPIVFGTAELGPAFGEFDEATALAAVRAARDLGINFFDTAHLYGFGQSERLLGTALRDDLHHRRGEVVISTKGGVRLADDGTLVRDSSPGGLREGVHRSLDALGVEFIDVYGLHWPDPQTPMRETGAVLAELVDEGLIRHVCVSNFTVEQMSALSWSRPLDLVQAPYGMLRRQIEADVLPYCAEHKVGLFVYAPLAYGMLTGTLKVGHSFAPGDWRGSSSEFRGGTLKRNVTVVGRLERFAADRTWTVSQPAIAWSLAVPTVAAAIVGTRSAKHIAEAIAAAEIELTVDDLAEIDDLLEDAVTIVGPTPESVG